VGKANRFSSATIKEESEESSGTDEAGSSESEAEGGERRRNADDSEEEESDEEQCGPFSRIHSLISSEKNRRIVNAGNKQEMQEFVQQSKQNSQIVINLALPCLKLLIADQKFLNDIYNCFLNDLIMWLPSPVPPIASALNLFYDVQNIPELFSNNNSANSTVTSPIQQSNLNYLIDYNFDTDFIATRMNLLNSSWAEEEEVEEGEKAFHMCRSAIVKGRESSGGEEAVCGSDGGVERGRRRRRRKRKAVKRRKSGTEGAAGTKEFRNYMSVVVSVEKAQLKAFVLNKGEAAGSGGTGSSGSMASNVEGKHSTLLNIFGIFFKISNLPTSLGDLTVS